MTFRNSNFLKAAVGWSVLAAVALGAYIASGLPAGLTGIGIVTVLFGLASYYLASWSRRTLRVLPDRVVIGHVFSEREVPWSRVQRFTIREPSRRTPFMLAFHWWADEAKVTLTDGSVLRVAGVEPWHGFTALSYFTIARRTAADRTVDWLNEMQEKSSAINRRGRAGA